MCKHKLVAEQVWMLVQGARYHLLTETLRSRRKMAETLRRKMVWTGAITTWAYSLQMSELGYISRFLRYQHSHRISV